MVEFVISLFRRELPSTNNWSEETFNCFNIILFLPLLSSCSDVLGGMNIPNKYDNFGSTNFRSSVSATLYYVFPWHRVQRTYVVFAEEGWNNNQNYFLIRI